MPVQGCVPSSHARARYRTPFFTALCMACAVAVSAAPAPERGERRTPAKADLRGAAAERVQAASAARFRRAGAPRAAELVSTLAAEPNPQVRYRLLQGLSASDPAAALPVLARVLASDPAPIVRVAAAQELGRYDEPRAARALALAVNRDADLDVRRACATSLGVQRSTEAVAALVAAAAHADRGVREHAGLALSRGPRSAAGDKALERLAGDKDKRLAEKARGWRRRRAAEGGAPR